MSLSFVTRAFPDISSFVLAFSEKIPAPAEAVFSVIVPPVNLNVSLIYTPPPNPFALLLLIVAFSDTVMMLLLPPYIPPPEAVPCQADSLWEISAVPFMVMLILEYPISP